MAYSSNNVAGKLITDAVSIGLTVLTGIFTAGIASPIVATGARIALGTGINTTFDLIQNQKITAGGIAKDVAFAGLSVGTAKVMRTAQEKVLRGLGAEDFSKTIGRNSSVLTGAKQAGNKPLSALSRVLSKANTATKTANASVGIAETVEDNMAIQIADMEVDSDFLALRRDDQDKIIKEMKDEGEKEDMSDKSSSDGNDLKPISVSFLYKPETNKAHMNAINNNHKKHNEMVRS